jgi:hypothetical protein
VSRLDPSAWTARWSGTNQPTPWMNRRIFGTPSSHTRAPFTANVTAEGGGTTSPTLMGGGAGFSR